MNGEMAIWKRVCAQSRTQALGEQLYQLARLSSMALEDYRLLAAQSRDRSGRVWQLVRWEEENLSALRGMFLLDTGREMGPFPQAPGVRWGREADLLYRRAVEQMQAYTALSAQPYYGISFGEMARRQGKLCDGLVGWLGGRQRKTEQNVRR